MKLKTCLCLALGVLAAGVAFAGELAVSAYWQDHMVLQRGKPITVWGKDAAGRTVTIAFAGQTATAVTGDDGFWETTFALPFAMSTAPRTLTIADDAGEVISLADILVGDVFLAAGQSNMDRRLDDTVKSYHEPRAVKEFCRDDDGIRFIRIARSAEKTDGKEHLFDLPPMDVEDADPGAKALAAVADKEPDVPSAPPAPEPLWSMGPYAPSAWKPLAHNLLAAKTGVTTGNLA